MGPHLDPNCFHKQSSNFSLHVLPLNRQEVRNGLIGQVFMLLLLDRQTTKWTGTENVVKSNFLQHQHTNCQSIYSPISISRTRIYFEFCKVRSVYMNQNYILIAFSNHNLRPRLFYKSKLPGVQINLHFGLFELVKRVPTTSRYRDLTVY